MDHLLEQWRPVVGFEGQYEVSNHGRVRSLGRRVRMVSRHGTVTTRLVPERILKPGQTSVGYPSVVLGRGNTRLVHFLVLEAFVGPRPPKADCRHIDGTRDNNRLDNLQWGSRTENILDAVQSGSWFSEKRKDWFSRIGTQNKDHLARALAIRWAKAKRSTK